MSEQRAHLVRATVRARRTAKVATSLSGLNLRRRRPLTSNEREGLRHPKACVRTHTIDSNPTLSQAWSRDDPGPQYAFKMSMFNVSCNSH